MVKSMTGYGVAQGEVGSRRVSIEAKSVNHKFCEINVRLPSRYASLESKILEFAKNYVKRGRIDLSVRDESVNPRLGYPKVDRDRLKYYHDELVETSILLKIPLNITLETLLGLPQAISIEEEETDLEGFWSGLLPLLRSSFESLDRMRCHEGNALEVFFKAELEKFDNEIQWIETIVPENILQHQQQLQERIQRLSAGIELDPQRLAQEVAYFVDRTDISEELQRFKHHVKHFRELLQVDEPVGRKLDFLTQEINREINTLSAKAQNSGISQRVVECKHSLEKIREQVQNIE